MFGLLQELPLATVTTVMAILLVAIYFVTSSDSGSLVIDMLTSGGNINGPKMQKVFWASLEGSISGVLLAAVAGGLAAFQTGAVTTALPFTVIMLVMCYGLIRARYADDRKLALDRVTLIGPTHEPIPVRADEKRSPSKGRCPRIPLTNCNVLTPVTVAAADEMSGSITTRGPCHDRGPRRR